MIVISPENVLIRVCVTTVSLVFVASMSNADVVVPGLLARSPVHYEERDDNMTEVVDVWEMTFPSFPDLTGQDGNLVIAIRSPEGKHILIDDRNVSTEFGLTLGWTMNVFEDTNRVALTAPSISFQNAIGTTPPVLFDTNYADFGSLRTEPVKLSYASYEAKFNTAGAWGFTGIDIIIPLSDVVNNFVETPPLDNRNGHFNMYFEMWLSGDQRGTPLAAPFTRLATIPEPSAALMSQLGFVFLGVAIRKRRHHGDDW